MSHYLSTGLAAMTCIITVALSSTPAASEMDWSFDIYRHEKSYLSDSKADYILKDASSVVHKVDSNDDVSCDVTFTRSGKVGTFEVTDGTIAGPKDLEAVFIIPGDIKVVNAIHYCNEMTGIFAGCALTPGKTFVVIRTNYLLDGIVWVHEYLHNRGKHHRVGSHLVMNESLGLNSETINDGECRALDPPYGGRLIKAQPISASSEAEDVVSFVKKIYVHGVPYDKASVYGKQDVPALQEALEDDKNGPFLANIVVVLGMMGGTPAKNTLLQFIGESIDRQHNFHSYRATLAAVLSLGYIVNKSGDADIIEFLAEKARGLYPQSDETLEESDAANVFRLDPVVVGRSAVLGLAVSGRTQTEEVLRSLLADERFQSSQDLLTSALDTHRVIRKIGLSSYYKQ